jgi:pre-mRNA-splicing factor ATP-dependent RNA helicase DHX38/PRP16
LDKLAQEKRSAAQAAMNGEGVRKKAKLDDDTAFKGDSDSLLQEFNVYISSVPGLPASRSATQRQRGEETPSRGPGLSESARKRLEEHRRSRDNQKSM